VNKSTEGAPRWKRKSLTMGGDPSRALQCTRSRTAPAGFRAPRATNHAARGGCCAPRVARRKSVLLTIAKREISAEDMTFMGRCRQAAPLWRRKQRCLCVTNSDSALRRNEAPHDEAGQRTPNREARTVHAPSLRTWPEQPGGKNAPCSSFFPRL